MKKTLYIIRHGETDLNQKGIVQGRGIDSSLNARGLQQAEQFYNAYKEVEFDKIYTSTLQRTHQTVAKFIEKGIPWQQEGGLDELAWGIYEGVGPSEETRAVLTSLTSKWQEGHLDEKLQGGDSPLDVNKRQKETLAHIMASSRDEQLLICMHGRAMRLFLCLLCEEPLSAMDSFPHQNLSLYKLMFDGGRFYILDFNKLDHLLPSVLNT